MRRIALVIAFIAWFVAPALAQKAEIEAVNAKWVEFFNKGDFAGVASLYTEDATAFPPGAAMVRGRRDRCNVERPCGTGQRSESHNSRRQIPWANCSARDRDRQPQDQGRDAG